MLTQHMLRTAVLLSFFAVMGTTLVAVTHQNTKEKIAAVERETLLRKLHAVMPEHKHDNDLFSDLITVSAPKFLGTEKPRAIYRARLKGQPTGLILTPVAPDGYGGDIKLLLGVDFDGQITGVRVLDHRETPG
ncbi:MAG: RnfABCDGE type electron transport complex subunit G, partial [Gammaproteobacteria bacterium]|nr:RnfABCDGE type electron transport complex subunit G [Gammaproteobacteria bacterium]